MNKWPRPEQQVALYQLANELARSRSSLAMCFDANGVASWEIAPVLDTEQQPDRLSLDDVRILL